MDPCCLDKNMDDKEFSFLGNDFFTPPLSTDRSEMDFRLDDGMDHDWFDSLFNDPVLNDCMISDALQPNPRVQSEHSYSLANNDNAIDMTVKKDADKDSDSELLTVDPNSMILTSNSQVKTDSKFSTCDNNQTVESPSLSVLPTVCVPSSEFNVSTMAECGLSSNTCLNSDNASSIGGFVKKEPLDPETAMVTVTRTMNPQTLLKPTIILATQQTNFQHHTSSSILTRTQDRLVLPKVNVKVEPSYSVSSSMLATSVTVKQETTDHNSYDQLSLPPTPPSSSTSDSEGCHSPERSAPSSPVRGATHYQSALIQHHSSRYSPSPPPSTSFFMNPIPTSGVLILSEEEKRTLISEGYPIPSKLPLTKGEEKNLKKIRRKIKNKISAQESRRKKKEYLESLEKKVESYSQENMDLKKKMDSLENNNRSLMSQLQKLQSLISKIRPQNSSQTGTCLMVLVLCFAVFLGTCSPMTWSIGYSSIVSTPSSIVNDKPISNLMLSENQHQNYNQPFSVAAPDGIVEVQTIFEVPKNSDDSSVVGSVNTEGEQRWSVNRQDGTPVIGPEVKDATVNPYSTKLKSRVLLSIKEESQQESTEAAYGWAKSFCLKEYLTTWFSSSTSISTESPQEADNTARHLLTDPSLPKLDVLDVETENNQTGEGSKFGKPAVIHPDVTVMTQVDTTA